MTNRATYPLAGALLALALLPGAARAQQSPEAACDLDRPVVFGGLDYDSASFHTAVARFILEKGYGCRTDSSKAVLFFLPLTVSLSLTLISDIDSPRGGLIRVAPQNLMSLAASMQR